MKNVPFSVALKFQCSCCPAALWASPENRTHGATDTAEGASAGGSFDTVCGPVAQLVLLAYGHHIQ